MRSTESKGEDLFCCMNRLNCLPYLQYLNYLAVERALDAAGEETEKETAEKQNLWMLHQVFGVWSC